MSNETECDHYWVGRTRPDGQWDFRMNRQMCPEPLMHVTCSKCNARTWFTEKQWAEIPIRSEP